MLIIIEKVMRRLIAQIFLVALLASAGPVTPTVGQTGQSPSSVTLADLSFITGLWRADWNGGVGEESFWPEPLKAFEQSEPRPLI